MLTSVACFPWRHFQGDGFPQPVAKGLPNPCRAILTIYFAICSFICQKQKTWKWLTKDNRRVPATETTASVAEPWLGYNLGGHFRLFFHGQEGEGEGGFCSVCKWWRSFANLTWFSRDSLPCPKIVSGRGSATQRSPSSCRTRLDSWNFPSPTDFSSPVGRCFISWVFFLIYELWCGSLYRSERRCYVQWMEFISKFIVTRWSSGPDKMDAQHWWPLYRLWLAGAQYFSL